MARVLFAMVLLVLSTGPLFAQTIKDGDHRFMPVVKSCPPPLGCWRDAPAQRKARRSKHPMQHPAPRIRPRPVVTGASLARVIGGRPPGCPARFCGCGASLEVFGRIIPELNLARNWLRFARTSPAPNTVAVRPGHVFVLKQHIAGNTWLVHDSNSGGRRTRIHPRSIAGYAIVNPHSSRVARHRLVNYRYARYYGEVRQRYALARE